jgi:hypothetical protein
MAFADTPLTGGAWNGPTRSPPPTGRTITDLPPAREPGGRPHRTHLLRPRGHRQRPGRGETLLRHRRRRAARRRGVPAAGLDRCGCQRSGGPPRARSCGRHRHILVPNGDGTGNDHKLPDDVTALVDTNRARDHSWVSDVAGCSDLPNILPTYGRFVASCWSPFGAHCAAYHQAAGLAGFLQGRSRGFGSLRAHFNKAGHSPRHGKVQVRHFQVLPRLAGARYAAASCTPGTARRWQGDRRQAPGLWGGRSRSTSPDIECVIRTSCLAVDDRVDVGEPAVDGGVGGCRAEMALVPRFERSACWCFADVVTAVDSLRCLGVTTKRRHH